MIGTPPQELFAQNPQFRMNLEQSDWCPAPPLDDILARLNGMTAAPSSIDFLDRLRETDSKIWHSAVNVLAALPPETIFEQYGEEVLAWTAAYATFIDQQFSMRRALTELAGYDAGLFERSRVWCHLRFKPIQTRQILDQYRLGALLMNGFNEFDLPAALQRSALPDITLSEKRLHDYTLAPITTRDEGASGYAPEDHYTISGLRYRIWLDAPIGFVLRYKGRPNAVAALALSQPDELMLYQLQRVRGKIEQEGSEPRAQNPRGLMPLDWQRVLVEAAAYLAECADLGRIAVQSGTNNIWADMSGNFSGADAKKAYDNQARRLGFTRQKDGNWHQTLPASFDRPVDNLPKRSLRKLVKLIQS